jgi:hypothetical protein
VVQGDQIEAPGAAGALLGVTARFVQNRTLSQKAERNQGLSQTFVFRTGRRAHAIRAAQTFTNLFQRRAESVCTGGGTAKRTIFHKSCCDPLCDDFTRILADAPTGLGRLRGLPRGLEVSEASAQSV